MGDQVSEFDIMTQETLHLQIEKTMEYGEEVEKD